MTKIKRRSVSFRLREDLIEALEETADELVVGRNLLVETAVTAYLNTIGDRLAAGATTLQALGIVR